MTNGWARIGILSLTGVVLAAWAADTRSPFGEAGRLFETACFACHGPDKKKAGIDLSAYTDDTAVSGDRKTWQMVLEQLAAEEMPPADAKTQVSASQRRQMHDAVTQVLARADAALAKVKDPGPALTRRLNRTEYIRTLQDLLGLGEDIVAAIDLPEDGELGYATHADTLGMPPLAFEKYYAAADAALAALAEPSGDSKPDARPAWGVVFMAKPGATPAAKRDAARTILTTIMRRAYRRPAQADEIARCVRIYEAATARGNEFTVAVKLALKAVLVSPNFLYRIERDRAVKGSTEAYRVSDHELATRLSYFLWSTMPDADLAKVADGGRLTDPESYEVQVRRLLADQRARALTEGFAAVWLQIARLERARPSQQHFPALTPTLRQAMYDETAMFIDQLRSRDGSLLDLLDSDYTYVNEELAKHYGLDGVSGSELRRVALKPTDHRGGVIGMGSVLLATSHTFRTSPTMRGKWVLEVLLGMPPPPPPAEASLQVDEAKAQGGAAKTFREQLERHVADAACAGCHRKMDPLGFAMENYDGIGAWRESVEVGGKLPSGEHLAGVADLKKVLWTKRERFIRNLVEQMFIYALGRDLLPTDETAIRAVVEQLAKDGYRFSSLVLGVARSLPFQYRRNANASPTGDPHIKATAKGMP